MSRSRPHLLAEGIPQLVWRAGADGKWIWCSPQWSDYTGLSPRDSHGDGWLSALHPDEREEQLAEWRRAARHGHLQSSHRLYEAATEGYRRFQTHATPLCDEAGTILEWLGTSVEVEELHQREERQRQVAAELRHRLRNTLSVIRSIARRTARTSHTLESYTMHLEGRLDAVARVQSALMRDPAAGIDLGQLIADELLAHAAQEGNRLRIGGPAIRLKPKAAEIVGLAIHELTTNAVKFGALSSSEAHLAIDWSVDEARSLQLAWKECGMNIARAPRPRGFGLEVLENTMAYELKARARLDFRQDGLHCLMAIPVESIC